VAPVIALSRGAARARRTGSAVACRQALRPRGRPPAAACWCRWISAERPSSTRAIGLIDRIAELGVGGEMRSLTDPADPVTALLRADAPDVRQARNAIVVLINTDLSQANSATISLDPLTESGGRRVRRRGPGGWRGRTRRRRSRRERCGSSGSSRPRRDGPAAARGGHAAYRGQKPEESSSRTSRPLIDAGRFAAKRIVGERRPSRRISLPMAMRRSSPRCCGVPRTRRLAARADAARDNDRLARSLQHRAGSAAMSSPSRPGRTNTARLPARSRSSAPPAPISRSRCRHGNLDRPRARPC